MTRFLCLLVFAGTVFAQKITFEPVIPNSPPRDLTTPIKVAPIIPPEWRCLEQASVREELKLTGAQKATLDLLMNPDALLAGLRFTPFEPIAPRLVEDLLSVERDVFLKGILGKEQRVRLKQIVYQLKEREFGAPAAFTMAAKDLGLNGDQLKDVSLIKGQRIEEIAKLVTSGERFEKVKKKVEATNGDTFEKMAEMLTRTQRERLKELKGKEFAGKITEKVEKVRQDGTLYPSELFGIYDFEARYLASDTVRSDLGITKDQATALWRELDAWEAAFAAALQSSRDADKSVATLHDRTAKLLGDVLTIKQLARFDELMVRRRWTAGGPEAACGYPAVVSELKLTPIQLAKLKEGKTVEEVLSKEQSKRLNDMVGKSFLMKEVLDPIVERLVKENKLFHREAQPAEAFASQLSVAFARRFLVISDRLRLSTEQIKKLRELGEDEPRFFELIQRELSFADTPPVIGASRSQTSGAAVAERFRDSIEEQCFNVLDEKQQSIARQIYGRRR